MEQIKSFFDLFNQYLWGLPMMALLLGTHIFLTFRLKIPQRKLFLAIKLSFAKDKGAKGDISPMAALFTSLAATLGTGNIIGVAIAVSLGGPGAVFWCWLTGVFGIATKYAEGVLAVKYRRIGASGEMVGGPMCALESGLNMKWLGVLFAVFTAFATFGIGNSVQSNTISTVLYDTMNISPYVSGAIVTFAAAAVILFGIKGIARVSTFIMPFMTILYFGGCIALLIINSEYLGATFNLIFEDAFQFQTIGSGVLGGVALVAMRHGVSRGLFSNEAGMGSAPVVAASAKSLNPVRQALISSTSTFWDTVVVCAMTGIVIVSSIVANPDINMSDGALLTKEAFAQIPYVGDLILTVSIVTFAFSTILAWYIYGEKAIEYLLDSKKAIFVYRIINIIVCYLGSILQLGFVWAMADILNAFMAIPNLISLLLLSGVVAKETNKYLWGGKINEADIYSINEKI